MAVVSRVSKASVRGGAVAHERANAQLRRLRDQPLQRVMDVVAPRRQARRRAARRARRQRLLRGHHCMIVAQPSRTSIRCAWHAQQHRRLPQGARPLDGPMNHTVCAGCVLGVCWVCAGLRQLFRLWGQRA